MKEYVNLTPSKRPTVALVGEFAYADALQHVPSGEVLLEIVPEPDNPFDNHAISVRYRNRVIGYVPRKRTSTHWGTLARVAASGKTARTIGHVTRQGNRTEVSIHLLAGDQALTEVPSLLEKATDYLVPDAYVANSESLAHPTSRPQKVARTVNQEPTVPRRNVPASTWLPAPTDPQPRRDEKPPKKRSLWSKLFGWG